MSEKFDGVRAYWNGRMLFSRHSKRIPCPNWFLEDLVGQIALDGELWLGRGKFELLNRIVNSNQENSLWKNIIFMVFDIPTSTKPFEMRLSELQSLTLPSHVRVVNNQQCSGNDHLQECLTEIVACGGEGLMLNKPTSLYIAQRTNTLLKVKVCFIGYFNIRSHTKILKCNYLKSYLVDSTASSKNIDIISLIVNLATGQMVLNA
jgi:DNA ligase-1